MNKSLSIFARALATENISFSFDTNAKTAAFDVQKRHLIMPVWNVSPVLQSMLIAHEISHALWTPYELSERLLKEAEAEGYCPKTVQRIANVIEDVRIERLMKDKYPGTRRDFFLGYKEIVDSDLFEFSKMDMNKAGSLTRINLHLKWGIPGFLTVNLDEVEQDVVREILEVETFEEVIALAKRLCKSDHKPIQDDVQRLEKQFAGGAGDDDADKTDEVQGDPIKGLMDLGESLSKKDGEQYTMDSIVIAPISNYTDQIIDTDTVLSMMEQRHVFMDADGVMTRYREFVRESDSFVRQLVAQFERRKAADEIRKERPKQTGMLNLDRLHEFRTSDDIFLSKIVKQEGKNHGICFMIDFSGSMGSVLENCVLQVMQLTWFCEKAKIPFEVFAFTDMSNPKHYAGREAALQEYKRNNPQDMWAEKFVYKHDPQVASTHPNAVLIHGAKLINLASSRDSKEKREKLMAGLYASYCNGASHYRPIPMGGTPTVESIMLVGQFMQKWVKDNDIQIPTLMVVTDGQPNGFDVRDPEKHGRSFYYMDERHSITVTNEVFGTVLTINGQENGGVVLSNAVIATMLESMRMTLNARIVGMYVGGRSLSETDYNNFCVSQSEWRSVAKKQYDVLNAPRFEKAQEMYKEDGCIVLHESTFPGYDCYFLIKTPKPVKDSDAIAESGSFAKIKNTFIRTMGKRSGSRVFLTKYVDIVAGQPLRKAADGLYNLPAFMFPGS